MSRFDRTSKADIGGKEIKAELDDQDLETTKSSNEIYADQYGLGRQGSPGT